VKLADVSRGDESIAQMAVTAALDAFPAWAALGCRAAARSCGAWPT
jgi:hypothetical protein